MDVIVQADDGAGGAVGPVPLDHLPPEWEPATAVGLDEDAPLVAVAVGLDDQDVLYAF